MVVKLYIDINIAIWRDVSGCVHVFNPSFIAISFQNSVMLWDELSNTGLFSNLTKLSFCL